MNIATNHELFKLYVAQNIAEAHPKFLPYYANAEASGLHYHNINHVKYILNKLLNLELILDQASIERIFGVSRITEYAQLDKIYQYATVLVYAAYGHDCYYDPFLKNGLNERISADITGSHIKSANTRKDVCNLILLTAKHLDVNESISDIEKLFLDLDLYTFADPIAYPTSSKAVEAEYSKIPRNLLVKGRLDFLKKLQSREKIFYIVNGEELARANIAKTIDDLELELEQLESAI